MAAACSNRPERGFSLRSYNETRLLNFPSIMPLAAPSKSSPKCCIIRTVSKLNKPFRNDNARAHVPVGGEEGPVSGGELSCERQCGVMWKFQGEAHTSQWPRTAVVAVPIAGRRDRPMLGHNVSSFGHVAVSWRHYCGSADAILLYASKHKLGFCLP
jgi:hypothetical protein